MQFVTGGVGFFDSGIGGLTVLEACRKALPSLPMYYLGDNARSPYGKLPSAVIRDYTYEALSIFARLKVQAVVLACNTVTAVCIEEMRRLFSFPLIGTEPAVLPAVRQGGRIGVLTTRATSQSARFERLLRRAELEYPNAKLLAMPCDELAGVIERNVGNPSFDYAPYLPQAEVDGIVLGCTHYVFIKKQIRQFYACPTYDGNNGVAKRLQALIRNAKPSEIAPLKGSQQIPFFACDGSLEKSGIFFLGGQKKQNERIYEQMFV